MLNVLVILAGLIFLTAGIYVAIAYFSEPKKWPFKKDDDKKKSDDKAQHAMQSFSDSGSTGTLGGVVAVIIVILFIGLFIFAMYWGIKMSMMRYQIAGDAIKKGNTGLALGALAPEIGEGVGYVVGEIGNALR